MYLLLLGTTALSLVILFSLFMKCESLFHYTYVGIDVLQVTTPLMFRLTPAIMNLGVLMHWFPAEVPINIEVSIFPSL